MIPLIGYTDRLSARPGEAVDVKVSSTLDAPYHAELVRVISGDPNPEGPGVVTEPVDAPFAGDYPSKPQATHLGSHMRADISGDLPSQITLSAIIWPTTPDKGRQGVLCLGESVQLCIGPDGAEITCGKTQINVGKKLRMRQWYRVWAQIDTDAGTLSVGQTLLGIPDVIDDIGRSDGALPTDVTLSTTISLLVAALSETDARSHFNGKIEAPTIYAGLIDADASNAAPLAAWDFAENMMSLTVPGHGPLGAEGTLVGAPARAMTGSTWDGNEMNWQRDPAQWAAIHFHDDDIADAGWDTDFTATLPDDLPSGAYAIKLSSGPHWDMMPVFVCPPKGTQTAKLCLIMSTFTYTIYANQARTDFGQHWRDRAQAWGAFPHNPVDYPDYGLSTYNDHNDGSGICHTTWHRPILNLRPGYIVFADDFVGSGLRHFPADTHLIAWLKAKGIDVDIVTDWELHHEGAALLAPYAAAMTTSHPEYHTTETLDAVQGYRDGGGNLIYLGGNGFYWRVALHPEKDGIIEVRRAEGGLRAWAAETGEYYSGFTGEYGGTWRRNARPPNTLVGIGYTCQGEFEGTYYRRTPASRNGKAAWIFDGIDDEIIGDFGLCGGGAAGYELDRTDAKIGTPESTIVLATSEDHPDHFVLPPEEWLTHLKTWSGPPPEELVRADMVYLDVPGGGAVFSVGSITFCGSLPVNDFDNNVSQILENVVRRFTAQTSA